MGVIAISTWGTRCEVRQLVRWVPEAALGSLSLRLRVSGFLVFSFVSFFFFLSRRRTRAVVRFRPASTISAQSSHTFLLSTGLETLRCIAHSPIHNSTHRDSWAVAETQPEA